MTTLTETPVVVWHPSGMVRVNLNITDQDGFLRCTREVFGWCTPDEMDGKLHAIKAALYEHTG